jgi:hypothetical protein
MRMDLLRTLAIGCPYCGEVVDLTVDCSAGDQEYIEDCQVCCRPIVLQIAFDAHGEPRVRARRDDD